MILLIYLATLLFPTFTIEVAEVTELKVLSLGVREADKYC